MADNSTLGLALGVKALVDVTYSAQVAGKDPVVSLVANGILFASLAIFAGVTKFNALVNALAVVLLLAALVFRGAPMLNSTTGVLSAVKNRTSNTVAKTGGSTGGTRSGGGSGGGGGGGV